MNSNYKLSRLTTLQHCIEISNAESMTNSKAIANIANAAQEIIASGKTPLKAGELFVTYSKLEKSTGFSFNEVHRDVPLPIEVINYPVVVHVVIKEGVSDKLFIRVKVDLQYSDGVTGMNTGFQVGEFMEFGTADKISVLNIAGANGGAGDGFHLFNFLSFLSRQAYYAAASLLVGKSEEFTPIYNRASNEEKWKKLSSSCPHSSWRVCRRYKVPDTVKFRDILIKIESIKNILSMKYFATTVNFSPKVCVAFVPDMKTLRDKKAKLNCITLPPIGAGAPADMDASHVLAMTDCVFLNNYGIHNPQFSGKVSDFLWDWQGLCHTFAPLIVVIQISGRYFLRVCCPPPEMKLVDDAKIFDDLGEPIHFSSAPLIKV